MFTIRTHKLNGNEKFPITSWIYLHGILETINGFDLTYVEEGLPAVDGIFDCTVIIDEVEHASKLYFWKNSTTGYNGLVVDIDDEKGNDYARQKFDERAEFV